MVSITLADMHEMLFPGLLLTGIGGGCYMSILVKVLAWDYYRHILKLYTDITRGSFEKSSYTEENHTILDVVGD
jgi:hypothetical protein